MHHSSRQATGSERTPSRFGPSVSVTSLLLGVGLLLAWPSPMVAQEYEVPEVSVATHAGLEDLVEPSGRAVLAGELAARWEVGFEIALGAELSYRDHEPYSSCPVLLHQRPPEKGCDPLVHLGPFEQLRFWTAYLEPRWRFHLSSLNLRPFLGGRVGPVWWAPRLDEPGRDGFEVAATGGIEYRPTSTIGVELSGLYGNVSRVEDPPFPIEWSTRSRIRAGLRLHF